MCANKFQESNPFLNRVFTKDLPSVLNGMMYMGLISTFFSFLACVDCTNATYTKRLEKCNVTDGDAYPPPFLLSHQNIPCWTTTHAPLALLGFWGVLFFLPIGMLAQGMNQVLFQQEALDIKYAPVVMLFSQLIKALTSTARAFPIQCAVSRGARARRQCAAAGHHGLHQECITVAAPVRQGWHIHCVWVVRRSRDLPTRDGSHQRRGQQLGVHGLAGYRGDHSDSRAPAQLVARVPRE